ncbi:SDR family NAD(P)-dependent oxidoreductase [Klenkia sp. PcliD-1-E]|nr:SDR family NAD(P)-dependent oxidoreductase [Klenkia sp. PcliD-1-E]
MLTGPSRGAGLAIATGLASAGAAVVLVAADPDRLAAAADQVRTAVGGADVTTVATDLAADDGTGALLAAVPATDVLVVVGDARPPLDGTDDAWRQHLSAGGLATVRLLRSYLPGMGERGWGRALLVSGSPGGGAALLPAADGFAGTGVTVNAVVGHPGAEEALAAAVSWLCAPAAWAVTGQLLDLTGGHRGPTPA